MNFKTSYKKTYWISILFITIIFSINICYSHWWWTNSSWCHNNRKTGSYHCHNSWSSRTTQKSYSNTTTRSLYWWSNIWWDCSSNKYNCSDFATQCEAQTMYNKCWHDIHRLDRDNDWIACENNRRCNGNTQVQQVVQKVIKSCPSSQCLHKNKCFNKPSNSICAPHDNNNAWLCNSGYDEKNWKCIKDTPIVKEIVEVKEEIKVAQDTQIEVVWFMRAKDTVWIDKPVKCEEWFTKHHIENRCVKGPDDAFATPNSKTDAWLCNSWYKEVWNTCVLDEKVSEKKQAATPDNNSNDDWWWGTLAFFTLVVWGYLYRVYKK